MHAIVFICYPIMAVYRRHFFRDLFRCAPNEIKCIAHITVAEKFNEVFYAYINYGNTRVSSIQSFDAH